MNEPHDPNVTTDIPSAAVDSAEALRTTDHVRASASTDASHPPSDASANDLPAVPGYRVLREIARGGMGCVLAAYDLALDREVALKVLLPGANADRFVRESKITARLPHPGIPPVYALGKLADGSPFLAMKLIAGRTFADELKSGDRTRLLQTFLQVCQAVGFAHSRGIIHRDLKPTNVMVGAFGEVQVMDWGLAKDLNGPEREGDGQGSAALADSAVNADPDATTDHRAAGESTDERTRVGQVLGTPSYMAPEQARGEAADAQSDVFALGGILCAILTGKPPFSGRSTLEVIRRAGAADLMEAYARLEGCGADAELIGLCRRCLSPRPDDRPTDGQAVADGLTAYLDGVQDRLRQAELAEAEARAKAAEEAKRRRVTLALAAVVLLAVLGGGGGWLYVKSERDAQQAAQARRQVQLTQEVNEALTSATSLHEKAMSAQSGSAALFAQAREQTQRARALVENGEVDASLSAQVRNLQTQLDEEEKDRVFVAALDEARLDQTEVNAETHSFDHARAVPRFRDAFRAYGVPAGEGEPKTIAERIRQRPKPVQQAVVAALDEWIGLSANPNLNIIEPHREWLQAVLASVEPDDAWSLQLRAVRTQKDRRAVQAALVKLAAGADVTKIPIRSLTRLAENLEPQAKVELLQRAQRQYPADFWVNYFLGIALRELKTPQYDEAVRFKTVLIALRPESPGAHNSLGLALADMGRVDEALAEYKKAIAIDPDAHAAYCNMGTVLFNDKRDYQGAIVCFRKAIKLDPTSPVVHLNLGNALAHVGETDQAIASYRKALELDSRNANATLQRLPVRLNPKYAKAPENLRHIANFRIGELLAGKRQFDQAIASYRQALLIDPNHADTHYALGLALGEKGEDDRAIASYRKAIELDPTNAVVPCMLGNAQRRRGLTSEAIASYRKAIELDPKYAAAHNSLGAILCNSKQDYDGAIECFRKAIALNPKNALFYSNLGNALKGKGLLDEAITNYRKAIAIDPNSTSRFDKNFSSALLEKGTRFMEAGRTEDGIASYRKAIEVNPQLPEAHYNLGRWLRFTGRYAEARDTAARAVALYPNSDPRRPDVTNLLAECERLLKVEARLPRILSGEDKPATPQQWLDATEICRVRNLTHAGVRVYTGAFAAYPKLADDLKAYHRYDAACAAALAAAGKGEDVAKLNDTERARLRKQALDWLCADMAPLHKKVESGKAADRAEVRFTMLHRLKDNDLASIRDKAALEKLPPDERKAFTQLWADVAALLKKAESKAN